MIIEVKIPQVGESISEVTIAKWLKKNGEFVNQDDVLCEMESEKATLELTAEKSGVLKIVAEEGATINIGDVAATIDTDAKGDAPRSLLRQPLPPLLLPRPPLHLKPHRPHPHPTKARSISRYLL